MSPNRRSSNFKWKTEWKLNIILWNENIHKVRLKSAENIANAINKKLVKL